MIILLFGVSGAYSIIHLYDLNQLIESVIRRDLRIIKLSEDALDDLYNMTAAEDKYLISGDSDYLRQFGEIKNDLNKKMNELGKVADSDVKVQLLAEIRKSMGQYTVLLGQRDQIIRDALSMENPYQAYARKRGKITGDVDKKLKKLTQVSTQDRNFKLDQSNVMSTQAAYMFISLQSLAVVLVVVITFINARKINQPIKLLGERTKEVADGRIGDPLKITSPPEIKELSDAFNVMCEKLKELDQMKIDYISHLSHELRTPLTVIKEASSMLQDGVFSASSEQQEELFDLIKTECDRLISSVSRLLDFSQMEAGNMYFSFKPAELHPVVAKSIVKLSPLIRKRDANVITEIPQNLPVLPMDRERIEQVFENLLSNALKYTPEGGQIIISAKNNVEARTVEISVSDNGVGIPKDRLTQVFDKFKRVDDVKGTVMGTGLGLSIVRHIVNAHGGNVWVKSKEGEGSTFTFSLPVS